MGWWWSAAIDHPVSRGSGLITSKAAEYLRELAIAEPVKIAA